MIHLLLFAILAAPPRIEWPMFFSRVTTAGVTYAPALKDLDGQRVVLRGFTVQNPRIDGGILMTAAPFEDPHEVAETDVPFDAVAVVWRTGLDLPPIPGHPSVEGTLRLGNRRFGDETVCITLEDAVPARK